MFLEMSISENKQSYDQNILDNYLEKFPFMAQKTTNKDVFLKSFSAVLDELNKLKNKPFLEKWPLLNILLWYGIINIEIVNTSNRLKNTIIEKIREIIVVTEIVTENKNIKDINIKAKSYLDFFVNS